MPPSFLSQDFTKEIRILETETTSFFGLAEFTPGNKGPFSIIRLALPKEISLYCSNLVRDRSGGRNGSIGTEAWLEEQNALGQVCLGS